ncbi:MAG TPA: amino acid permease [Sphingomonas sp.]|nr:amino acid permease [Sphingomonas sp.]
MVNIVVETRDHMMVERRDEGVGVPPGGRGLGFWMCTALVVGNMIGSGVFLLPASLAPFGWNALLGWLVTIAGALALAFVFARLAQALPQAGGPYAYTEAAFGPGPGFVVAWTYWLSIVIGNAAIAIGSVSYMSVLIPVIGRVHALPPLLTVGIIWALTLLNCLGARSVGGVQLVVTLLKLLPLAAVMIVAVVVLASGSASPLVLPPVADIHPAAITGAAALALWALLGLESATVPADKVIDAPRTIPRATLFGTASAGLIYLCVCAAMLLLMPAEQLARSPAPFADFLERYVGGHAGPIVAAFAALSALGALNGWVLLQGELPSVMAQRGLFPRWLARTTANGTPVRAHCVSGVVLTATVMMNFQRTMVDLFTFIALLSTTVSLFAYLFSMLAALNLQARGRMPASVPTRVLAIVGAVYSLWAIWGAGARPALWGLAFLMSALPIYLLMRRSGRGASGWAFRREGCAPAPRA